MRLSRAAQWVTCAFFAIGVASAGDVRGGPKRGKKRASKMTCMKYSQAMSESGVDLTLRSGCEARVTCEIRWVVRCGDDDKDTAKRQFAESFSLDHGDAHRAEPSAAVCGDESWEIDDVRWSCQPVE